MAWTFVCCNLVVKVVQDLKSTDEDEKVPRFFCGHIFQLVGAANK